MLTERGVTFLFETLTKRKILGSSFEISTPSKKKYYFSFMLP